MKRRTGRAVEIGNPTVAPLIVGLLFVCFGAFTAMRGTLINNLWWVVVVTFAVDRPRSGRSPSSPTSAVASGRRSR